MPYAPVAVCHGILWFYMINNYLLVGEELSLALPGFEARYDRQGRWMGRGTSRYQHERLRGRRIPA